jgi:TPR repeat protein
MYDQGAGVTADPILAYKWIFLAARAGEEKSKTLQSNLESRMTPEQIEKAKALAAEWKK